MEAITNFLADTVVESFPFHGVKNAMAGGLLSISCNTRPAGLVRRGLPSSQNRTSVALCAASVIGTGIFPSSGRSGNTVFQLSVTPAISSGAVSVCYPVGNKSRSCNNEKINIDASGWP